MNTDIYATLAVAFGGYSQVPDKVIGMALAGQINNGELLGVTDAVPECDRLVDQVCKRWEDQGINSKEVRDNILNGMKEEAADWGVANRAWGVIRALEARK